MDFLEREVETYTVTELMKAEDFDLIPSWIVFIPAFAIAVLWIGFLFMVIFDLLRKLRRE